MLRANFIGVRDNKAWKHIVAGLIIAIFLIGANYLTLQNYDDILSAWGDDNLAYYAERYVDGGEYAGDLWHNTLQKEYVFMSGAFLIPAMLYKYLHILPVKVSLWITGGKLWLLAFALYFFTWEMTRNVRAALFSAVGTISGYAVFWNLGMFAYCYNAPYQSDIVYPLTVFTFILLLRRRFYPALGLAALIMWIHPSIGLYTLFFIGLVVLYDPALERRQKASLAVIAGVIAVAGIIPSRIVLNSIPASELGSAKMILEALNSTHGGLWEWEPGGWWLRLQGFLRLAGLGMLAWYSTDFEFPEHRKVVKVIILGAIFLVVAGIVAKVACDSLINSPLLKFVIPFHQLLFTRASVFLLILFYILGICFITTWAARSKSYTTCFLMLLAMMLFDYKSVDFGANHPAVSNIIWGISLGIILLEKLRYKTVLGILPLLLIGNSAKLKYLSRAYQLLPSAAFSAVMLSLLLALKVSGAIVSVYIAGVILILTANAWRGVPNSLLIFAGWHLGFAILIFKLKLTGVPYLPIAFTIPAIVWVVRRLPQRTERIQGLLLIGTMLFAGVISFYQSMDSMNRVKASDPRHGWFEAAAWASQNTSANTSFIMLTDYSEYGYDGWRTYAHRGKMQIFDDFITPVYTADLRYIKAVDPLRDHFTSKYPALKRAEILDRLSPEDFAWLTANTPARYALTPLTRRYDIQPLYYNDYYAIYDLRAPFKVNRLNNNGDVRFIGGSGFFPPPNDALGFLGSGKGAYSAGLLEVPLPHWLEFDFGGVRMIDSVSISWYNADNYAIDYRLYGKERIEDAWRNLLAVQGNRRSFVWHDISVAQVRYVRMEVLKTAGQPRLLLRDLRLLGSP